LHCSLPSQLNGTVLSLVTVTPVKCTAATLKELESLANTDPTAAIDETTRGIAAGLAGRTRARLLWIRGLAHRRLRAVDAATFDLESAVEIARTTRDRRLLAQALISLAGTYAFHALTDAALRTLAEVPEGVGSRLTADLEVQRAFILQRAGRTDDAEVAFAAALRHMARARPRDRADLLSNRGIMRTYQGRFDEAETDLVAARVIYDRLGLGIPAAELVTNIAWLDGRRGELVRSLRGFDEASRRFAALGVAEDARYPDECEAFLAAGLAGEAYRRARRAAALLERDGAHADAAELHLLAARAALAADDAVAAEQAAAAARRLSLDERPGWAAEAQLIEADARVRRNSSDPPAVEELVDLADRLDTTGMPASATDALLLAARVAIATSDQKSAETIIRRVGARRPMLQQQVAIHGLRARSALNRGKRTSARRELRSGCRLLDGLRRGLGASELRAQLALHGRELADLDLDIALVSSSPAVVLRTLERWRAVSLSQPRLRPPPDPSMRALLEELRAAEFSVRLHIDQGRPDPALERRLRELQQAVLRYSRTAAGADPTAPPPADAPSSESLAAGWSTVVLFEHRGTMHRLDMWRGRRDLRPLAAATEVRHEATHLRAALVRALSADAATRGRHLTQVNAAAARLDRLLLGDSSGDGPPLRLVLPSSLAAVPWACLPRLRERPFTIVPSVALWDRLARQDHQSMSGHIVLAAGPDLRHADDEVNSLADLHRSRSSERPQPATVAMFDSRQATTRAVAAALDGAAIAHVACHGVIVASNPLLSRLLLADGPLFVYDLELIEELPAVTVLSACHVGAGAPRPGDEMLGFTTSLLSLGSRTVIAASQAVPDSDETVEFMRRLHLRLIAGDRPAHALAAARSDTNGDLGGCAAAFSCFGLG
jgi:hypothetical protein